MAMKSIEHIHSYFKPLARLLPLISKQTLPNFFSLLILGSCGKNISDKDIKLAQQISGEDNNQSRQHVMRLHSSQSRRVIFRMPRPATFKVPSSVYITGGSARDKHLVVRYNGSDVEKEDFEFQCTYFPRGSSSKMYLHKCTDYYGSNLGDISGHFFALDYDDIIDMEVIGPIHFDISIENIHEMKWF